MESRKPKEMWLSDKGGRISGVAYNGPVGRGDMANFSFCCGFWVEHEILPQVEKR